MKLRKSTAKNDHLFKPNILKGIALQNNIFFMYLLVISFEKIFW